MKSMEIEMWNEYRLEVKQQIERKSILQIVFKEIDIIAQAWQKVIGSRSYLQRKILDKKNWRF